MSDDLFALSNLNYALDIFAGNEAVARVALDPQADRFALQYTAGWQSSVAGYALSPHLPLGRAADSHAIRRFLENLLPEGRALDVASTHTSIQKNNIFGLIRYLGQETTGGLSFLPAGQRPAALPAVVRELSPDELARRIAARAQVPFSVWDGKVRMSIAGYQDKLLAHWHDGRWWLADGAVPSTHILKPEPLSASLPCMVANEHFCMQLAGRISQQRYGQRHVAEVSIVRVPSPVLVVKRFDRAPTGQVQHAQVVDASGQPTGETLVLAAQQRLHIIDGCQLADLPPAAKYERNLGSEADVAHIRDGASFEKIFAARAHLETPALGMQRLVLWAATTLLLGNSDAHGKNISFHVSRAGLNVAELYDLVSVTQYPAKAIDHELAMAFGDVFALDGVKSFALADLCERCGIPRAFFARELDSLCNATLVQAPLQAEDTVYTETERALVQQIASAVVQRATALKAWAKEVPKFKRDVLR